MVVTSAIALACAAIVVLLWFVIRLQRQVGLLSSEVSILREDLRRESASSAAERHVTEPEPQRDPQTEPESAVALETPDVEPAEQPEQVSVITRMPTEPSLADDDLTTVRIASVALGGPLIKVAAFSHGVRRALDEEQRMRISYAVRKELRRQRKMRRRRRAQQAPSQRWGP